MATMHMPIETTPGSAKDSEPDTGTATTTPTTASTTTWDRQFAFTKPVEMIAPGDASTHPVVIVGAGPVGLTMALSIAKSGLRCVLLEDDSGVCSGSRALGMSRRTLEIWEALGAVDKIRGHGKDWSSGRSFYRGKTILDFSMPDDELIRNRPMFNIQQYYTEKYLVEAIEQNSNIDLRWQSKFLGLTQQADHVRVEVETPEGSYELKAAYVVACDGARSAVRSSMALKLEGTSYEATYVIADIRLETPGQMERRCWFDPPSNPDLTILMHGQPDKLWRLDYQLGEGEDAEEAVKPENVMPRIQAHLDYIGEKGKWTLEWISPYRVHSRALKDFRNGRVFFAGDAAHLMPIFGIRGLNSGVEDAWNLGWKIAQVHQGLARDGLLDSYNAERHNVFAENAALAERNAWFMTPPNQGVRLMRDAVLSLAMDDAPVADILNPKQASYVPLRNSVLNTKDEAAFDAGPGPGDVLPDINLDGGSHLQKSVGNVFSLLYFAGDKAIAGEDLSYLMAAKKSFPDIALFLVTSTRGLTLPEGIEQIVDSANTLHQRFDAAPGTTYLSRPDHNIAARWRKSDASKIFAAIRKAKGESAHIGFDDTLHAPLSHAEAVYRMLGNALAGVDRSDQALLLAKISLMLGMQNQNIEELQTTVTMAMRNLKDEQKVHPVS